MALSSPPVPLCNIQPMQKLHFLVHYYHKWNICCHNELGAVHMLRKAQGHVGDLGGGIKRIS